MPKTSTIPSTTENGIRKIFGCGEQESNGHDTSKRKSPGNTSSSTKPEALVIAVFPRNTTSTYTVNHPFLKPCIVSDGKDYSPMAYLLGSLFESSTQKSLDGNHSLARTEQFTKPFLMDVKSYIVSKSCSKPLLFITSGTILASNGIKRVKTPPPIGSNNFKPFSISSANKDKDDHLTLRIQGGIAPRFLSTWGPILRNEAMAGLCVPCEKQQLQTQQNLSQQLSQFLTHHHAVSTLHQHHRSRSSSIASAAQDSSTTSVSAADGDSPQQHYMKAVSEFQMSQLDRQKASLTSNSGREDAKGAALIETQYLKALEKALGGPQHQNPETRLTRQVLCDWHAILCGEGVHAEAGRLRTKLVRVGEIRFAPHKQVPRDLDSVCESLSLLQHQLLQPSSPTHPGHQKSDLGWQAATFAACVFFSLIDVHGFCDGNGRLARIAVNWALQKAGLPFCIHLFATPAQRKEYTDAITLTRRNLSLVPINLSGDKLTSQHEKVWMLHALEYAGVFKPLVDLILDRVAKAITEFEKIVQEKSHLVTEEAEAKAAKRQRDRERAGTCLICFEDNPNIATLCCGKAVHLNCVAQWISSNASCPNCRENFPALPRPMQAPSANQDDLDDTLVIEDTSFTASNGGDEEGTDTTITVGSEHDYNSGDYETASDDDTTNEVMNLVAAAVAAQQHLHMDNSNNEEDQEEDDDTTSDSTTMEVETTNNAADEDDTASTNQAAAADGTSSTTSTAASAYSTSEVAGAASASGPPPFCSINNCRNRAARDCTNQQCGRCCLLLGSFACNRHNNE